MDSMLYEIMHIRAVDAAKKAQDEIGKIVQQNLKKAKQYYTAGNLFSSEEYFHIVLRYDPTNKEAKSYLEKIEKGGKQEDADKWYLKGIDAYTKHKYELAISYWERCLSIDPGYDKARKNIERARKKLIELGESP
jgi:tetratricopeptide (TPR) repeat protein